MKCPRCRHDSPPTAKFCAECGATLARDCARCGTRLPFGAKFCPECVQPLAGASAPGTRFASPAEYTPKPIAEKILSSKGALEGERGEFFRRGARLRIDQLELVAGADAKLGARLRAHADPVEA